MADIYTQVDKATDAGIVWAQGMGSAANITWTGAFSDPDGDGWHNFSDTDECNDVDLKAYPQIFYPWLRWDDEVGNASSIRDLDIYLLRRNGDVDLPDLTQLSDADRATFNQSSFPDLISIQSKGDRSGRVDQSQAPFPLEITTTFGVQDAGTYCLAVNNVSETKDARPAGPDWMQMQIWQTPEGENTVEYSTPGQPSVITPADSANEGLIAVAGADPDDSNTLISGSGRGPTRDGRTKPDIVVSEIDFAGGHIEAAAVAGALAALVKQRYPDYSPQKVAEYLKANAESRPIEDPLLGPNADPNNTWGHGFAMLPDDVEDAMPPMVDTCLQTIDGSGTYAGSWDDTCLSENRPNDRAGGGIVGENYYARYYTFTLDEDAKVTITLTSDDDPDNPKVDTFLYLIEGREMQGSKFFDDDGYNDSDNTNRDSKIEEDLPLGTFTIEATTYDAETTGNFTLVVDIEVTSEPPEPTPDVEFIAISSGANHVCAIATDGSIMCWGDDSERQVSDRPTSGSFTQISSGDNHTCALRNDGAVICWGSIDVP